MKALLILGPTASGKSALSMALAQKFDVEIISIDSALVYRGMDIGSAKPTRQELAQVPHHLIDIRDIGQAYSAAEFYEDCVRLMDEIAARGRFPLIVGGTMLYAKVLREGIDEMPSTDAQIRCQILEEGARLGWPAMHEKLKAVDPVLAARLSPNDQQRIGRALEVWAMTGRTLSSFQGQKVAPALNVQTVALIPQDRSWLHAQIEKRFDAMLENGFLDEVRGLMQRPDFDATSPAMRAVGYRQAIQYLTQAMDFEAFHLAGVAATRQLAKRQLTWLRSMTDALAIDPLTQDAVALTSQCLAPWAPVKAPVEN